MPNFCKFAKRGIATQIGILQIAEEEGMGMKWAWKSRKRKNGGVASSQNGDIAGQNGKMRICELDRHLSSIKGLDF